MAAAFEFLKSPIDGILHPIRFDVSAVIIAVLHAFHLAAYECSAADYFHHFAFVLVGTSLQVIYGDSFGGLSALYHFSICGLPGALDYLNLALVAHGFQSKQTRLKMALEINVWLRAPGLIMSATLAYIWLTTTPWDLYSIIGGVLSIFVSAFNGQYYSRQVAIAYGKKEGLAAAGGAHKKTN